MHLLAPLADMVNHNEASRKVGVTDEASLVVYAGADVPSGGEVTITYGSKCNTELASSYGFELPGNRRTACEWDAIVAKKLAEMVPRANQQPVEAVV